MARKLTAKEFFLILSRRNDLTVKQFEKIYYNIIDFFVTELQEYNNVFLPCMGTIEAIPKGEKIIHIPLGDITKDGEKTRKIYKEAFLQIKFKPSDTFKNQVNGVTATRATSMKHRAVKKAKKRIELDKKKQELIMENAWEAMAKIQKNRQKKKDKNKNILLKVENKEEELKNEADIEYEFGTLKEK